MTLISVFFTLITALLHLHFLILEMFLWTKPLGLKTFKMSLEKANASKILAANQGLYNGMLAIGLLISFFITNETAAMAIRNYCLAFIVIAGCYGWYSLKSFRVFLIQALPALIALALGFFS